MKNEILALLIAKFAGVSEQILSRIAEKLAKTATTTEQATTAVEGVTLQSVIDGYADSRATEATASGVANYEKKYNIKDGKAIGDEPPIIAPVIVQGSGDDTPAWAKTLIDRIDAIEGAKVTDTRKQRFDAIIANLPEIQKKSYQRTTINSLTNEEFDELATEVTAEVEAIEADVKAKGSVFQLPLSGGDLAAGKPSEKDADAVAKVIGL